VPSGIDLERFAPLDRDECRVRLGWVDGRRHILFPAPASRPEKRYQLAEAAVARLRGTGCEVDLHELDGVVHDEVPTWINASDAVLLTSTHEGSPNVVKEALACNVPVVAVDVGDVRQRLARVEGCFVAAPTAAELAAKLSLVLSASGRVDGRSTLTSISLERTAERLREISRPIVGFGAVATLLAALTLSSLPDGRLHLVALDIGQGDAILVTAPSGATLLVDGCDEHAPVVFHVDLGTCLLGDLGGSSCLPGR